jgi:hypothetical protein
VPPEPVYFQGNSLWSQVDQLLQQWYGSRWASYITPAGFIRFYDTTSLTGATATLDSQPWVLDGISEDTSECYTQVVLRGRAEIEPAYLSLHDGTLIEGFTSTDKTNWKLNDYEHPKNAYSIGAITAQTSTTVTVQSDSATETWGVNYWSGIQAQVSLFDKISTLLSGLDWRTVTANTALTAGGTSTLTLDRALAGSGFNRYQIRGQPSGISETWRKYTIKNTYVAQHLVEQFNHSVPWSPAQNVVAQVTSPRGEVWFVQTATGGAAMTLGVPADFEVIPYDGVTNGYVRFLFPVVKYIGNSDADLAAGTGHYIVPSDIMVVVPFSRGTMTVQSPSGGGYAGTAFSRFNVQRTLYRSYPSWIDKGNAGQMQTLADEIAKTVHDVVIEGGITYQGKYSTGLIGGSWPFALSIAKATGTTSYESMAAPVRTVVFEWMQSLSEGAIWLTHLSFSTRRQMYSGDRLYVHPNYTGGGILAATWGMAGTMSPGGLGVGGQAGYGTEVMGTQAPDFDVNQAYAGAAQGLGEMAGGAAQGLSEAYAGAGGNGADMTAKQAREAMEGPAEKRKRLPTYKAPERKAQGLRGVTTTQEQRELAAESLGTVERQQRENTEDLAARENRRRHMTMGFSSFASGGRSPTGQSDATAPDAAAFAATTEDAGG